jgi:hypothetical protein
MSDMRESIIEKLNDIPLHPVFSLSSRETEWIVRNWIETQTGRGVVGIESDIYGIPEYNGGYFVEVTMGKNGQDEKEAL